MMVSKDTVRAAYDADGYAIIEHVYRREEISYVLGELRDITHGPSLAVRRDVRVESDAPYPAYRKLQGAIYHLPSLRKLLLAPALISSVQMASGSSRLYYYASKIMCKVPKYGSEKPLHQDAAYWDISGENACVSYNCDFISVWIALEDATRANGCLYFFPGSHKLGAVAHSGKHLTARLPSKLSSLRAEPVSAGTVIIIHPLVLHKSTPNKSEESRLAAVCEYSGKGCPPQDGPVSSEAAGIPWRIV